MLITPALLHVKTRASRGRQEAAIRLEPRGLVDGYELDGLSAEDVLARLDVPVLQRGPEATEWDCIRADHAAMGDAGEWDDVLEALRFADSDRTMVSGGYRVAPLISEGTRAALLSALDAGDLARAEAEVRRFEAVHALHVDNYAAAHLLAEALIDLGAAKLAMTKTAPQDPKLAAEASAHFLAAESILSEFDPIEEMSPLLAATRYHLLPYLEEGRSLCRDWYEDWCDLDPEDALVHANHAALLLPGPGESSAGFEKAARKAASLTSQITGKAAYAIFHLTAVERLGKALPSLDLVLLSEGLLDFQSATDCQHRANVAANLLTELLRDFRKEGPSAAYKVTKVRVALSEFLWNRLREVHLESWEHGADSLAFALSEVFGPALRKGARVQRAGGGLGTRVPRI
ncbi:MAG TPA: hypothetical protein PKA03_05230 [Tabrizicola sp.]|nr:hypothetical protein [Tabrizicola sp.]